MFRNGIQIGLTLLFSTMAFLAGTAAAQPPGFGANTNDFVLKNRDLVIRDSANRVRIRLDAQSGDIRVLDVDGNTVALIQQQGRNLLLGGNGRGGDLVLLPRAATGQDLASASVHIDGSNGTQSLGGGGEDGQLVLRNKNGKQRIFLDGETADLILGQEGADGDLFVRNASGQAKVTLDGTTGRVRAGQIVSEHSTSGSTGGIDTASLYLESANPAIGFRDSTGGNTQGWLIQSGSGGGLHFSAGDLGGLGKKVFVLQPDGGVCIGTCN